MIGISNFFGFVLTPEKRVELISKAGFDTVITTTDDRFLDQNGTLEYQSQLMKKYNLKPSSLHMKYTTSKLPNFWKRGLKGYKLYKDLKEDVKLAKKYGFNSVVVHLVSDEYTKYGEKRLLKVLKLCEELDVPLAIENIDHQKIFLETFEHIKHPYLKFCYDVGHNNVFDPDFDYLTKFGDKLVALHLHDNMGKHDDHTLNLFGNIDWDEVARKLALLPPVNLDYELLLYSKPENLTPEEVVEICAKQGRTLETKIDEYRKQNLRNIKMTVSAPKKSSSKDSHTSSKS